MRSKDIELLTLSGSARQAEVLSTFDGCSPANENDMEAQLKSALNHFQERRSAWNHYDGQRANLAFESVAPETYKMGVEQVAYLLAGPNVKMRQSLQNMVLEDLTSTNVFKLPLRPDMKAPSA